MKAVMISIRPEWCQKIVNGQKTVEVRKTRPKMDTPFKGYIYCTKGQERLVAILKDGDENYGEIYHGKPVFIKTSVPSVCDMYGKRKLVIGEFICDRIYELETKAHGGSYYVKGEDQPTTNDVARQSCLDLKDMHAYLNSQKGYGWHISDFKLYDKPLPLNTFKKWFRECAYSDLGLAIPECEKCTDAGCFVQKPPQSWFFVEEMR